MAQTVLILGATGKIGSHAAIAFAQAGWTVKKYDRRSNDMLNAAKDVDVIVNGLNPPNYHDWARLIPEITEQVIAAAKISGATVIIPGNVYNFGATPGVWSENTPQNAKSRKGKIRIEMENSYRNSDVRTIILRAGNFIDPLHNDDVMGLVIMRSVHKNRITSPGDPNTLQTYCYLPDWANAAVGLARSRSELKQFEDVPFPGHVFTIEELRAEIEQELGKQLKLTGFPWVALYMAMPFWELARELIEMRYLWNINHQLDGTRLKQLLPDFQATQLSAVFKACLPRDIHPDKPMPATATPFVT